MLPFEDAVVLEAPPAPFHERSDGRLVYESRLIPGADFSFAHQAPIFEAVEDTELFVDFARRMLA